MQLKKMFLFIINLMILSSFVNCSYVVDSIEAAITKRSSFSIEGSYASGLVTISWKNGRVGSGDEAFAGYELYMTEQPDNEFIGYSVLIAPYDLGQDVIIEKDLRKTDSCVISFDPGMRGIKGVYFFRTGIIQWDKTTKDERAGTNDDDEDTTGWMPYDSGNYFHEYDESNYDQYDDNEWFYVNKTNLSSISGSVMIDIR